ncbi:MAG TPA: alkaline phosphatase family protein [Candidatus Dormibacteraeota bacterium]|nr:alkaline phosphatase family protein [Candidatus Dormibacteraeota bacterium]
MPRVLVVGLDALDPTLVEAWLPDLPNIRRLCETGIHGPLESIVQPVTPAAWTAAISGRNPGHFGFTDFVYRQRPGYGPFRLVHSGAIGTPTLHRMVGGHGLRLAMIGVPVSYPPVRADGAVCVSCFMAPTLGSGITSPPELQQEILAATSSPYLLDVTAEESETLDEPARRELAARLVEYDRQRFDIARHLMRREWDLLFLVCMGTDRVGHYFMRHQDPAHRRHVAGGPFADTMREQYRYCDRRLGELVEEAGPDTAVLVMSDHGMQRCDGHVHLNQWLYEHGYLKLRRTPDGPTPLDRADVDWAATRAWARGYGGQVYCNVRGRDPAGRVQPDDVPALCAEIEGRLRDDLSLPVAAYLGRDLYDGPAADRCPDLCLQLDGLHYLNADRVGGPDVVVPLGPDGVDDGSHAPYGFLAMAGAGVSPLGRFASMHLLDVAPTILDLLGLPDHGLEGRALHRTGAGDEDDDPYTAEERGELTNRLRALYLE